MIRNLLSVLFSVLLLSSASHADVVFDSFDAGGGFHPQSNLVAVSASTNPASSYRMGAQFLVGGNGYTLDSVTLPISQQNSAGLGNFLRVRIANDSSGAPGSTVEVLSLNQPVPQFANPFVTATTFNSTTHPRLNAGSRYWLVVELSSLPTLATGQSFDFRWFISNTGPSVPIRHQVSFAGLPADPWTGSNNNFTVALRVNGTPLVVAACCNRRTGACGLVETTICQGLSMVPLSSQLTCSPNPCAPGCPGDFNQSGAPNVQDIFDFLAAWFAGC